jgi:hypothetical protein
MKKQIKTYFNEINTYIENTSNDNLQYVMQNHLNKISFFQHERLIHLLVTLAFAILTMISFIFLFINPTLPTAILTGLFLILLIPYIFHYHFLENSIQKMYKQYDKLIQKAQK